MEANKTAHCPAFNHLVVMIKSGVIGEVIDIEASLSKLWDDNRSLREFDPSQAGGSMYEMGSYPLLPIVKLLGIGYERLNLYSRMVDGVDMFTRGVMRYPHATCSFKVGLGVKTEGNLVISGTKGYAYVPAPWWKTDYFELRYEGTAPACATRSRNSSPASSTTDSPPPVCAVARASAWLRSWSSSPAARTSSNCEIDFRP